MPGQIIETALLIPTYNAGEEWLEVLQGIDYQLHRFSRKIVIDSGSTDKTVSLAESYGFEVIKIEKSTFNHGGTRQLLMETATNASICIFLTQDAVLSEPEAIGRLIDAFNNDRVGLAYGRQLPRKAAQPLEVHARLFNYPAVSRIKTLEDRNEMGIKTASCSNSFAAYRRTALTEVGGFPLDSIFGEDVIVGGKMLLNGWNIAYVAEACAYHSHDYTPKEEFKRYFDIGVFHKANEWLLDTFGKANGEGLKYLKSELRVVIKRNLQLLPKMLMSVLAKIVGYKLGLLYKHLPRKVCAYFSMHRSYWKLK